MLNELTNPFQIDSKILGEHLTGFHGQEYDEGCSDVRDALF